MLAEVLLRGEPNAVWHWKSRAALAGEDVEAAVAVYTEALETIDVEKPKGNVSELWVGFARVYEDVDDVEGAADVFARAHEYPFVSGEELARVVAAECEMLMRHDKFEDARAMLRRATAPAPQGSPTAGAPTVFVCGSRTATGPNSTPRSTDM